MAFIAQSVDCILRLTFNLSACAHNAGGPAIGLTGAPPGSSWLLLVQPGGAPAGCSCGLVTLLESLQLLAGGHP